MVSESSTSQTQNPRFIQNRPCGTDKFEGGSQKRLAKTIARHFTQNDSQIENALPRIIGIEGIWGSGKSNVVKMLEKELNGDYYFFEYDAWGHQEDLQRRSILELLTSELINEGILSGKTTLKIKGGENKTVTWSEKLKYLLARKTETVTEKYPRISNGMATTILVAILTPIFTFIAYAIKPIPTTWWFSLLSILIAALPIIIALFFWCCAYRRDRKYKLSYLLAIYQDKIENDICYETLSEEEPTVSEFKTWMQDISDFIGSNKEPKLVIVFDNMDRLPSEKVKELWSSIHTFFADNGFENVWAVIPFDESHLACAFGDESKEETKRLTKYFINKTFPIVYRVAPPVITDYRNIFNELFIEAFGETEADARETINRIFRLTYPNANVREIISFINEIVALQQEWETTVSIVNIALFCLKKDSILKNPVEQILSGEYLSDIQTIIGNGLQTQREISALVYGVDVEHAKQIPLTKYIENCIKNEIGYDINEYSDTNKQFDTVLDEVVKNTDQSQIDNVIKCLNKLTRKNKAISRIWQQITEQKIKEPLVKQELSEEYKLLLMHLNPEDQNRTISQLYLKIIRYKEFNGADYYNALKDIKTFIAEKQLGVSLQLQEKQMKAVTFIDYIRAAGSNYEEHKVTTDPIVLDTYLVQQLPDKFNHADVVAILKGNSTYTFPNLLDSIIKCIDSKNTINSKNIGALLATYKILANERPLPIKLDSNYIQQLHAELKSEEQNIQNSGYYDLVAILLAQGHNISLINEEDVKYVAEVMDYYVKYEGLLINSIGWNIPLLNNVLQYMTNNKLGYILSPEKILPQFENIKNRINVTEEAFIQQLANRNDDFKQITKNNIKAIIPLAVFYDLTTRINNTLTNRINQVAIEALSDINVDDLYNQRTNYNSYYWHVATKHLLDHIDVLPDNLTEFGKKILNDIASGTLSIPLPDYLQSIIDKLDKRKTKSKIKDIKNSFCNGQMAINAVKFKFFEAWFRLQGDLFHRAGDVVDKILKPVINDSECRTLILQNDKFYIDLIKEGGDDSYGLKQNFMQNIQGSTDEKLIEFAKKIGIEFPKRQD